jgi:hypothetical protein
MKNLIWTGALILLILFTTALSLQPENLSERIGNTLKKYTEQFPQEKIYIHTDRSYYLAGETIWMKAYLAAGTVHQASTISNTVYIELLNDKNETVRQFMLHSENGSAHGEMEIPADLKSGNYVLRAYTNWMRNFNQQFFYTQEIKIWNLDSSVNRVEKNEPKIDIQFFAEGGHLVAGMKTNVAFKAIGQDGLGKEVKGKIFSDKGSEVTTFASTHLGMGVVSFIPEKNTRYFGVLDSQVDTKFSLPAVEVEGVAISVTNNENQDEVIIKVQISESIARPQTFTLSAHQRGDPSFMAQFTQANVIYFVKIPKNKLPHGLSHLTLFDSNAMPLCERLIFIDNAEQLQINISGLKESYQPREKVELQIETKNEKGEAVPAQLSLSALNMNEVAIDPYDKNINNYLLLTSDLKGHIESPDYYFDTKNADRYAKLNLLLLTQGWSRFDWNKILTNQWPELPHYVEKGINIQGTIVDDLNRKPVDGGKVTFFTTNNLTDILVAAVGKNGRFIFDDVVFYDSSQAVLQGENKKGKNFVLLEVDDLWPKEISNYKTPELSGELNAYERTLIAKGSERRKIDSSYQFEGKTIMLEGVEVTGKKIDADQEKRVYMGASKTIRADKVLGSQYMLHPLELLRGTAGIRLVPNPPGYDITIRGVGSIGSGTQPLIVLDNVPIDISMLNTIPVSTISSVDVFRGAEAAAFGSQGANGVIAFFTKQGNGIVTPPKGVFTFNFAGYHAAQEFYSPKYDVQKPEHVKPDSRVTIFWQPIIKTNAEGKASVSFYNPDPETTVHIQVEGMTIYGLPGVQKTGYQIRK